MEESKVFLVYRSGIYPKPKKYFYAASFTTRQKARRFCRNRSFEKGLVIVHPNGKEELFVDSRLV